MRTDYTWAGERELWDRKYRAGSHGRSTPDPLLLSAYTEFVQTFCPEGGAALDVAGGLGRHAIWLARCRWDVTLVDISAVAIEKAQKRAGKLASKIEFLAADLNRFDFGRNRYDLILVFFYLQRELFPKLERALRPGGLLIYKTYTVDAHKLGRGPTHPLHLLKHNELLRAFTGLRVLHYQETV